MHALEEVEVEEGQEVEEVEEVEELKQQVSRVLDSTACCASVRCCASVCVQCYDVMAEWLCFQQGWLHRIEACRCHH